MITQTLFWGSRPWRARTRVQVSAAAGRSAGRILLNLVERGKLVPRPALGVVLGGRDREISQTLFWGSRPGPGSKIGQLPAYRLEVSYTTSQSAANWSQDPPWSSSWAVEIEVWADFYFSLTRACLQMHSFESGLLPEERRHASLCSLVEHGKPVPRPALGVVLRAKDRGMG